MRNEDLQARVNAIAWYHTLELQPGVVTPGFFDTREAAIRAGLPADLTGKRCLDVGTFDGFWAYEMERRGASEVVAIDILDPLQWDWPAGSSEAAHEALANRKGQGEGFEIAREAIGSQVKRLELSVYDLDPASIGTFDFVYVGSILLHLRDPVRAIEAVASVCTGAALFVDAIDVALTLSAGGRPAASLDGRGRPWWWRPNVAGLVRMIEVGGFEVVGKPKRFLMPPGPGLPAFTPKLKDIRHPKVLTQMFVTRQGDPHAAVHARPKPT